MKHKALNMNAPTLMANMGLLALCSSLNSQSISSMQAAQKIYLHGALPSAHLFMLTMYFLY